MNKNFLINLFYQKKLPIYLIAFSIFAFSFSFSNQAKAQTIEGRITTGDVCQFGDDFNENNTTLVTNVCLWGCDNYTDEEVRDRLIEKKSCFWNQNSSNCKRELNGKVFYCTGEGKSDKTSKTTSKFVECSKAQSSSLYDIPAGKPIDYNISINQSFADPSGFVTTFIYEIKYINYNLKLPSGCQRCSSSDLTSCPGAASLTSTCSINLSTKTCDFGNPGTDCSSAVSNDIRPMENGKTYFCTASDLVVECDGDQKSKKYTDILESSFTQVKSGTGCRIYRPSAGTDTCTLNTIASDNTCKFGPTTTQNSTSNPAYKSCPDAGSDGKKQVGSKYLYCSPSGVKVTCNSDISYNTLFKPETLVDSNYTPYYNYSGKNIDNDAKTRYGCEIQSNMPPAGCSITASSKVGDTCTIPKDCYNSSAHPIQVTNSGVVGGLYCISKSTNAVPDTGSVFFCQWGASSSGISKKSYADLSEITTKNGVENVYFKSGSNASCRDIMNVNVQYRDLDPLSPLGLIRSASTFLYYFAIFYFIVLMLTNAFAYVRSGEDPAALKKIKESLFNTIAGFLFVLLSGGVIVYLINQFTP